MDNLCHDTMAKTSKTRHATGRWSLAELASGPHDAKLESDVKRLQKDTAAFAKKRKQLSPGMSKKNFSGLIGMIEGIVDTSSRIEGYASLLHAADTQSDTATSLLMRMSKLDSDISNQIMFFDLWWKQDVDDKNAVRLAAGSGDLEEYLLYKRRLAKYTLSEPEERIINTLDVTGVSALVTLYDKITNAYEYKMRIGRQTRTLTREEISNYVRSPKPHLRKAAYVQLLSRYESEKGVIGQIYQNVVQNWHDELIKIRGHASAISARNIGNNLDDATVDSLLAACKDNTVLFQKFFKLKAKLLCDSQQQKMLRRYDLYAPILQKGDAERRHTYDAAVKLVLRTLGDFSPELGGYARDVISKNHVDSEVRPGKRDGAFCSTISPGLEPYILMSFTGRIKDVFTLAHEMGHAVHSQAAASRSILVQHAPIPLAETASTFSELLLYDAIDSTITDSERLRILVEKIDDLYASIMRQAYFTLFEIDAHKLVSERDGTVGDLSDAYVSNLKEQFGRSVTVSDDFAIEWGCIPHFYHSPFYCYAYSFGNLLSLSLFQRYKKEGAGFAKPYVDILAAGGSQKPEDLLASHGFDISSPAFWNEGFEYIAGQIKTLEGMA